MKNYTILVDEGIDRKLTQTKKKWTVFYRKKATFSELYSHIESYSDIYRDL